MRCASIFYFWKDSIMPGPIDKSAEATSPRVNRVSPEAVTPEHLPEVTPEVTPVVTPINQRVSSGHLQGDRR